MITKTPELNNPSLYEYLKMSSQEDCDICDEIFDWGVNLGYGGYNSFEEIDKDFNENPEQSGYYKFLLLCCLNIKVIKPQPKWYTICRVSQFIDENRKAFDRFMNEENWDDYCPKNYENKIEIDDELFYDIYLTTFENLCVGNYSDSNYVKLVNYLLKENDNGR